MLRTLYYDESGFIVSAELVLISTLLVIGLIVGLSSLQYAVVSELNDVAKTIGSLNQSYTYTGFSAGQSNNYRGNGGGGGGVGVTTSSTSGSSFNDHLDDCDTQTDIACDSPLPENQRYY